jgi:prepilin peptidase CpaA
VLTTVAAGTGSGAVIDLRTRRLPNALTLGLAALGIALAAMRTDGVSLWGALGGFALGLALMLPGHIVGATGAGDVKLFAAIGTLLGPAGIAAAFVYTAVAGGVVALVVAARRRRLRDTVKRTAALVRTGAANVADIEHESADNRFAYAPAIAIGGVLAALGL